MTKVLSKLEKLRQDLELLIKICEEDLSHPFIVATSQKLDILINEYNKSITQ
ncbi:aspartyl-phosphate phosphatase Spo0E family protein [Paramaledivibacter caminithermalis]|jgi:hypothetical protein|uniref:Spo0E like sporulation regulatory protein n=1 Tax=Paramaledivibacter caminithermalis (strain DSM 15212 / CIP 107654 / DViRD3) TaxID=1121301 RepID=A0A1M6SXP0_PARC5|nr:aspartyl-phosphate phosphatase Spo0E family protein [Paramaledivibacter caminithermalis]SHK49439.1 Spo0E like sporulation regulatory protein [Paramaledivibacter caminithermalis DSM 15212]